MNIEDRFLDHKGHHVPSGAISIQSRHGEISLIYRIYMYFADG
jgi:hypothetical protein